jgi:hypothetical protein
MHHLTLTMLTILFLRVCLTFYFSGYFHTCTYIHMILINRKTDRKLFTYACKHVCKCFF